MIENARDEICRECRPDAGGKEWNGTLRRTCPEWASTVEVLLTRLTIAGIVPPFKTLKLDYSFARELSKPHPDFCNTNARVHN